MVDSGEDAVEVAARALYGYEETIAKRTTWDDLLRMCGGPAGGLVRYYRAKGEVVVKALSEAGQFGRNEHTNG